jgi:hypothetical protein
MNRIARYYADQTSECHDFDPRGFDPSLPLQTNWCRHFDPTPGAWLTEEPIAFAADEANLRKYMGQDDTGNQ